MNHSSTQKNSNLTTDEKRSVKILMEKMGLPKKEIEQISNKYGVSASQLIELMQYSKYQFIYQDTRPDRCRPCKIHSSETRAFPFLRKGA